MTCLLLNADAQPVSYMPLSVLTWQEAIKYVTQNRASVLEWHNDWTVRSINWETKVPSIIMLREYLDCTRDVNYSKFNVLMRDEFKCQYCGQHLDPKIATIDHVFPASLGGKTYFENCTTACPTCNVAKGSNPKIKPKTLPHHPTYWELVGKRRKQPFEIYHDSWKQYI